jgi:hypothetical protein
MCRVTKVLHNHLLYHNTDLAMNICVVLYTCECDRARWLFVWYSDIASSIWCAPFGSVWLIGGLIFKLVKWLHCSLVISPLPLHATPTLPIIMVHLSEQQQQ